MVKASVLHMVKYVLPAKKRSHFASVCLSSKQIKSVCAENSSESTDYEDNQLFIGSAKVEVETKQLTELNSSENNITPEKDQLSEHDSSENNFVEDNDSLKHFNDQIGAKQSSPMMIRLILKTVIS